EIPDEQRRDHRAGGNLERFEQERAQEEDDQDHREEADRVFDPPGLLRLFRALLAQPEEIDRADYPGHQEKEEEEQREAHGHPYLSSICRTARKASCGISTEPTCFMRFLPSFCFSRSFFLRVMSPP